MPKLGIAFGIEAVNRYENHLINTARQSVDMIERVGADNIFVHLDTYHMNIEEKGQANGILDARPPALHPPVQIRPRHSGRRHRRLGRGLRRAGRHRLQGRAWRWKASSTCRPRWAMASAVWRPVADSFQEVMDKGLPFPCETRPNNTG